MKIVWVIVVLVAILVLLRIVLPAAGIKMAHASEPVVIETLD